MTRLLVDAVLFDMDGTLVEESDSYYEAIRRTAEFFLAQTVTLDEVARIKSLPGFNNDFDATWALIGGRIHGRVLHPGEADRASYTYRRMQNVFQTYYLGDRLWHDISGNEPPFPWAEPLIERERPLIRHATLDGLGRFALGIATSRSRVEALMALHQHELDRFFAPGAVVCRDDTAREKPAPDPLLELVARLGCTHPVYVGNSPDDALAAREAGMPFIHVGSEPLMEGEDTVAHRVQDVNDILETVLGVLHGH